MLKVVLSVEGLEFGVWGVCGMYRWACSISVGTFVGHRALNPVQSPPQERSFKFSAGTYTD